MRAHGRSEPVCEMLRGDVVDVFSICGQPHASTAYASSHETDTAGRAYVAVVGLPPVQSARDAVRASIAAERTQ
jgi:hypothetical protein